MSSPKVKVHYEPPFNILTRKSDEILELEKELTLIDLFEIFYKKYGHEFKKLLWDKKNIEEFHRQLVIIINGRTYRGKNFLQTIIKNGDDLSFLYVYFGG